MIVIQTVYVSNEANSQSHCAFIPSDLTDLAPEREVASAGPGKSGSRPPIDRACRRTLGRVS